MVEEKIIKMNLRKDLKSIPKWRRQAAFGRILREKFKNDKMKIDKKLNEKIWSLKNQKIRVKLVKDDKSLKAELVE